MKYSKQFLEGNVLYPGAFKVRLYLLTLAVSLRATNPRSCFAQVDLERLRNSRKTEWKKKFGFQTACEVLKNGVNKKRKVQNVYKEITTCCCPMPKYRNVLLQSWASGGEKDILSSIALPLPSLIACFYPRFSISYFVSIVY